MNKKTTTMLILSVILSFVLCACGVSKDEYGRAVSERDNLQAKYDAINGDYDALKEKYEKLESEHNELIKNTADWLKMSEDEKSAQLAKAEAERIAAEEEEKKAKEEQAAAEAAARKAEEEKNAGREAVKKPDGSGKIDYPVGPVDLCWNTGLLKLESFRIVEIRESSFDEYRIFCELIGTASREPMGVALKCYDKDGFVLEEVTLHFLVAANERFKVTDSTYIPLETVRIEFAN